MIKHAISNLNAWLSIGIIVLASSSGDVLLSRAMKQRAADAMNVLDLTATADQPVGEQDHEEIAFTSIGVKTGVKRSARRGEDSGGSGKAA